MAAAALPIIPESAPFAREEISALNQVFARTSNEQRQWLAGYLAGYAAANSAALPLPAAEPRKKTPLTILYATQSGNSEALAYEAKKQAARGGFTVTVKDVADTDPAALKEAQNLLVIAATWGEGDPPERALDFMAAFMADDAPRLDGVRYSVLALGDSSYAQFCATGRLFDERLAVLGAERVAERVECDLDFAAPAAAWTKAALAALEPADGAEPGSVIHVDFGAPAESTHSRANPFAAPIRELVTLTSSRSSKETWHAVLDLAGSGLTYEPGDAIGVVPQNDPATVAAILAAAGVADETAIVERLTRELDVTVLTKPLIENYAKLARNIELDALLENDRWHDYASTNQIVDLLRAYPAELTGEQLTGLLRKLPARLYSVASSLAANPDEAHLLVALFGWRRGEEQRLGVASGQFARRLEVGDSLPVYVQPNRHFRLPESGDVPVVMVGPGTGVAPFRGFMQERRERGAPGRNWLFFGERQFTHDFLYQLDWLEFMDEGLLSKMNVAFSRDRREKRYVQHEIWDERRELFAWLEDGAHFYLCGDADRMAKDVETTLKAVAADHGRDGDAWLADLRRGGRYHKDVY